MLSFRRARPALLLAAAAAIALRSPPPRKPIRRRTSPSSWPSRPAASPTWSRAWSGRSCRERLGHTVVVENRGGAGGNLAARAVSAAAPDGYTILATTTALAVNETASKNKGFSVNDLRAVAIVAISPDVLAIHPSNPAKDLKEFIANGRDKSFTYGSAGVGTGPHIGAEYFFREVAKVKAVHVPFTGGAPAIQAAIGNHVDAIVLTLPTVVLAITQGLLRGIGLASPTRNAAVPNVPTYGEMGFPNVYSGSWVGFFAPAKTAGRGRGQAQCRDQPDHEGPRRAARSSRPSASTRSQDARRDDRLLQERGRQLGQDGARNRILEQLSK